MLSSLENYRSTCISEGIKCVHGIQKCAVTAIPPSTLFILLTDWLDRKGSNIYTL